MTHTEPQNSPRLAAVAQHARALYAERVAHRGAAQPWWTAVIITASSSRQGERYAEELRWRREQGKVPDGVTYLVVPDLDDERIGSGGATLNALRRLAEEALGDAESLESWWSGQRVLMVHSGGDSRRLPQYSLSGKLFSALPVKTPWGETSTVFDEMLALSSAWAARLENGLVVASGDVILTFDADSLHWDRPGVSGVAMREPLEVAGKHGVFVMDADGRVYSFLQKPSDAQIRAAGGLLPGETAALDTGLFRFDAPTAARLTALAGVAGGDPGILARTADGLPYLDLYEHFTMGLTGEWAPGPGDPPAGRRLADALRGVPFHCDLVEGEFTHVGTTRLFRQLMTETTAFSALYEAQQRLGMVAPPGLRSAGVIVDSALAGGVLGTGAVAVECDLAAPITAAPGAILHGLTNLPGPVRVPMDTVAHQVPVALPDGRRGTVIRVYGVNDDPKAAATEATWFGRPLAEMLAFLGLDEKLVWPDEASEARSLWNARLFPLGTPEEAWACARWMMGLDDGYSADRWAARERLSLANSAGWADGGALAEARARRMQHQWQMTAFSLADAGADIRPLLAHAPGVTPLRDTGRLLEEQAVAREASAPSDAASGYFRAHLFYAHAGLVAEAQRAHAAAFERVRRAVDAGVYEDAFAGVEHRWHKDGVTASAAARVDLGGGWSDTPPFCLDWGGAVLNMAVTLEGEYPIRTAMRRVPEPLIRCISADTGETVEYRTAEELLAPPGPGDPFAIPRAALQMAGLLRPGDELSAALAKLGGGLEARTQVRLPMGSGLGASSILAATVLQALAAMLGLRLSDTALSDQVLRLEQLMTTGGGWQDQAGAIFPGIKLISTGPGARQRLRVQPLVCSPERLAEFSARCVLYYTGIQRIAKDLLAQIVGRYLARETDAVQVLHSIKTLATEMAYAISEGEWDYLGQLIDRHWRLNQVLDEHTTNAPISALLAEVKPYIAGAKLAGAGGGGFLIMICPTPEDAEKLRRFLADRPGPGRLYQWALADEGIRIE
jgi:fucokinase